MNSKLPPLPTNLPSLSSISITLKTKVNKKIVSLPPIPTSLPIIPRYSENRNIQIPTNTKLIGNKDVDIMFLNQLDDYELGKMCQVNKYVNSLCDDNFWRNRTIRKYNVNPDAASKLNMNWKNYYKMRFNSDTYKPDEFQRFNNMTFEKNGSKEIENLMKLMNINDADERNYFGADFQMVLANFLDDHEDEPFNFENFWIKFEDIFGYKNYQKNLLKVKEYLRNILEE